MGQYCKICGRRIDRVSEEICDKCEYTLCEYCGEKLSRGYCAICGRLVCDDHSKMVGYARVCNECLVKHPQLESYNLLKSYLFEFRKKIKRADLKLVFSREEKLSGLAIGAIGLDDTDSPYGMCTTYLSALIIEKIHKFVEFIDYPYLVRLNPNVPFKTRGNASVKILFELDSNLINDLIKVVLDVAQMKIHAGFPKTQPAISFYFGKQLPEKTYLSRIYESALKDIITLDEAFRHIKKLDNVTVKIYSSKYDSRGIVGSLAALGANFDIWTYELIAYRSEKNLGKPRNIDKDSVIEMNKMYKDFTFANIDGSRVLITPQGPDPVLFGIRGFVPEKLIEAARIIKGEQPSIWVIFKTNQGTNAHILEVNCVSQARPYQSVRFSMQVLSLEELKNKVVLIGKNCGWTIYINIYKPHGSLRTIAKKLNQGDVLEIVGNVVNKYDNSVELNLEELKIISLMPSIKLSNPFCPKCGVTLKSKGIDVYKCKKCGYTLRGKNKILVLETRNNLPLNQRLLPPSKSWRHLTKPPNFDKKFIKKTQKPTTQIFGHNLY